MLWDKVEWQLPITQTCTRYKLGWALWVLVYRLNLSTNSCTNTPRTTSPNVQSYTKRQAGMAGSFRYCIRNIWVHPWYEPEQFNAKQTPQSFVEWAYFTAPCKLKRHTRKLLNSESALSVTLLKRFDGTLQTCDQVIQNDTLPSK